MSMIVGAPGTASTTQDIWSHISAQTSISWHLSQKAAVDGKRQEIIVLDSKRSNAINIGLTVLPPPRTIKTAILNFDEYALNKEGIEVSTFLRNSVLRHKLYLNLFCVLKVLSGPSNKTHLNSMRPK